MTTRKNARISVSELARRLAVHRNTAGNRLRLPGAPRPDRKGLYNAVAAVAFVRAHLTRGDPELRRWSRELTRLKCEQLSEAIARERGDYISRAEYDRTARKLGGELNALLREAFVQRLPALCRGRDTVEIAGLAADLVEQVAKCFREGKRTLPPLESK